MIRITLDTSVLPAEDLVHAAQHLDCDFAVVTVTEREVEGTRFEAQLKPYTIVHEIGTYTERVPTAGLYMGRTWILRC